MLPLLVALPIAVALFRDVDDPKVPQDKKPQHTAVNSGAVVGLSAREAFRDWRFWLMCVSFVAISFGVGGIIPNLENLLGSKNFERDDAVTLASLIGVSVVVGRLGGGFLIDRIWAPAVAVVMLVLPALSCYFLMQGELTYAAAAVAVLLVGLTAGAEQDLMAFLVSRYFGMRSYGVVYGVMYSSFALGAGMGPWVMGRVFEASGSYDPILGYVGVAFVVGALPLLLLGPYRRFEEQQTQAT